MDYIYAMIQAVQGALTYLVDYLRASLNNIVVQLSEWFGQLAWQMDIYIRQVWDSITFYFEGLVNHIHTLVQEIILQAADYIANAINTLAMWASNAFDAMLSHLANLYAQFQSMVASVVNRIEGYFERALNAVSAYVQDLLHEVSNILEGIGESVVQAIQTLFEGPEAVIRQVAETVGEAWERIGELKTSLEEVYADATDKVVEKLTELKEGSVEAFTDFKELMTNVLEPIPREEVEPKLKSLIEGQDLVANYRDFMGWLISRTAPNRVLTQGLMVGFMFVMGAIPTTLSAAQMAAEPLIQELRMQYPTALLGPSDCVAAWRRGMMDETEATNIIRKQGFSVGDASHILKLQSIVPTGPDLIHLMLRGLITEGKTKEAFHHQGYDEEWSDPLIKAAQIIPGPQDLVWMAVREMFTPSVYETFKQLEGFPEDIVEWGEKVGLSRFWLEKYWGAHWSLPSPQQGFEMLHRGEITMEQLQMLLKALDLMPFWRKPLIEIAYQPLTRVDVRRMHKLGVLTDESVTKAYKDLGYNAHNAELMTKFTKEYNAPRSADVQTDLDDLTRSNIIGFYKDGIINRTTARSMLIDIGFTEAAADIFLDAADYDQIRKERKDLVQLALDLYDSGTITYEEAENRLRSSGLETIEIERALQKLYELSQKRIKWPSMSDAMSFLKRGLISIQDYEGVVKRQGYTEFWIDKYVKRAQEELSDATKA